MYPVQRVSSDMGGFLEDRFYCMDGVLLSDCPLRQVLLHRGCPLIRVSLEDRFYCIEGVLSSECPLKTGFTV